MRFNITFSLCSKQKSKNSIPINYQYELSSWIYKTLNFGNPEFSEWLHKNGYTDKHKNFKLFTFSNLDIPKYKIIENKIQILSDEIFMKISFLPIEAIETFIKGLFKEQKIGLGNSDCQTDFIVKSIEKEIIVDFKQIMKYRCISPLVVTDKQDNEKYDKYLTPDNEIFSEKFSDNLISKFFAFNKDLSLGSLSKIEFKLLNTPKKKGITIKQGTKYQTKIIGYMFDFELTAPIELQKIGYYAGFGRYNSQGFGCVDIIL